MKKMITVPLENCKSMVKTYENMQRGLQSSLTSIQLLKQEAANILAFCEVQEHYISCVLEESAR